MSADPAADPAWQPWFESVWAEREDRVYRDLFGDLGGGVYAATAAHYQRLQQTPRHPGWLHHGVFACPPHGDRTLWTYVTSGLSNPWNLAAPMRDPSGFSGLGFELCLCTAQRADWAVPVLHHLMAWQLLVATGAVTGQPLAPGQRIPLGGPIDATPGGALTWALVEAPDHMAPSFELPSGRVDWLLLVGATEREVAFARSRDQRALLERLRAAGCWPCTQPQRDDVA
jgi:hypothetical protein